MASSFVFNPLTSNLDLVVTIPQLTSDPVSPNVDDLWVLKSGSGGGAGIADGTPMGLLLALTYTNNQPIVIADGTPMGLLLALTYTGQGGSTNYKLSYYTAEGSIVRKTLS